MNCYANLTFCSYYVCALKHGRWVQLFVLFISLLNHFWFIHFSPTSALPTACKPCQSKCVQSHQRHPRSTIVMATCEVQIQVSAADYQTPPTVGIRVSKLMWCPLTLTFTLTSANLSLNITLLLYWLLHNAADILTPTTVAQGVDNHSWGLYCRHCCCICICWGCCNRIFHWSCWLGQLSTVLTKDESPHAGYTFTLDGFFYPPSRELS